MQYRRPRELARKSRWSVSVTQCDRYRRQSRCLWTSVAASGSCSWTSLVEIDRDSQRLKRRRFAAPQWSRVALRSTVTRLAGARERPLRGRRAVERSATVRQDKEDLLIERKA